MKSVGDCVLFSIIPPPSEKLHCEVGIDDDFAAVLADGILDETAFVFLRSLVTYAEELLDAAEPVNIADWNTGVVGYGGGCRLTYQLPEICNRKGCDRSCVIV